MGTLYNVIQMVFIVLGVIMVGLILLRKSDVSSLSGAFGGMGGDTAFGVKTQKQLDKIITYVSVCFIVAGIFLNMPKVRGKVSPPPPPSNKSSSSTPSSPANTPANAPANNTPANNTPANNGK